MSELSGAMRSWIADAIGPGSHVRSIREMRHSSTEMHDVLVETAGGTEHRLVVRRYSDRTHLETVSVVDWPTAAWGPPGIDFLIGDGEALEDHDRARFETWVAGVLAEL